MNARLERAELLPAKRLRMRRALVLLLLLLVMAGATGAALVFYRQLGRTPGELMDYAERRMEGHPKLETLARPMIMALRSFFDAPSAEERARLPFVVPPPPPRRGANDVPVHDPAPAGARVWRVSPNGPLSRISEAARLARAGDVVEIEAGDYHQDVAVWRQSKLTIRGVNGAARLFADGQSAEGKAIWVIRKGEFDISAVDFIGAKVADGNGAGIRFEGGHLRLRDCLFWGNQLGLLSGGSDTAPEATLVIENSEFAYSHVQNHWAHNLYVGTIASLTVSGSYFHHASVGHLLKSRARVNNILYNRLTDESGGRASYELEFPNGGVARVVGNVIQQQRGTEHSVMIAFGAEGYTWPVNALYLGNNTLVNDHPHGGTFLRVAPGADRVLSANNLLVGLGGFQVKDSLTVFNNFHVGWEAFVMAGRQDFRLRQPGSGLAYRPFADPATRVLIEPTAQYEHPRKVQQLATVPSYAGAHQPESLHRP